MHEIYQRELKQEQEKTLWTCKYSAIADLCSLFNLANDNYSLVYIEHKRMSKESISDLKHHYLLALPSQTQQCTPRRPLYTHKMWLNPKSSAEVENKWICPTTCQKNHLVSYSINKLTRPLKDQNPINKIEVWMRDRERSQNKRSKWTKKKDIKDF